MDHGATFGKYGAVVNGTDDLHMAGQRDAAETMDKLGIDSFEDLFLLMTQAHLPMPRLADATTDGMVQTLQALPTA